MVMETIFKAAFKNAIKEFKTPVQLITQGKGALMKVLVACEFSGIVREVFKDKGHDAWSCDLLPTEIPGQHLLGNVLDVL